MYLKFLFTVFILLVSNLVLVHSLSEVLKFLTKYKKCFHQKYPMGCLKEKVLIALNETIQDDRPIVIGFVEIQKNPEFFRDYNNSMNNYTEKSTLPEEATARSLTDTLMQKLEEFFRSRTLKVNLANAFQGKILLCDHMVERLSTPNIMDTFPCYYIHLQVLDLSSYTIIAHNYCIRTGSQF